MLQLSRGIALRMDVRDLLQLQGALQGNRVVRVAPDVEHVPGVPVLLREPAYLVRLVQDVLGGPWERAELVLQAIQFVVAEGASVLTELQGDQVEGHELRDERLRRRDADLDPGARVDRLVGLPREARADHVRDREGLRSATAGLAGRPEGVGGLAALRDQDHEGLFRRALAVPVLRGEFRGRRDPRELLEDVLSDEGRMVRAATGDELHARHTFREEPVHFEVRETPQEGLWTRLRGFLDP